MRYAVAIADRYGHAECFVEVADSIREALRDLGHEITRPGALDSTTIILGPHLLDSDPPPGSILYNLEQVDSYSPWLTPFVIDRFRRFQVWDYDRENTRRLRTIHDVNAKTVPIGYHPCLSRIEPYEKSDIDVLFYGSINDRRAVVLDELRQRGVKTRHIFNVYGKERDNLIARSKIVLNLHFYSAQVFEIVRCSYLLANRVAVVSETPRVPEFKHGIAWAEHKHLADECLWLLSNEEDRISRAAIGYDEIRARPMTEILRHALA
jgi:hypothetical protein